MEEEKDKQPTEANKEKKEKEIDLMEIIYTLWSRKKLIVLWCVIGMAFGVVIAFSIPKEYTTEVTVAPETMGSVSSLSGSLGALASMAGISANSNNTPDAVYPTLYPDVVNSVPFITSLFDVPVTDQNGNVYLVKDFIKKRTKGAWWGVILGFPGKMISAVKGKKKDNVGEDHVLNNFQLTDEEALLVKALRGRITADVDQKTDVITIKVSMQDPMVSAVLADTVVKRLRQYITDYRTNKARKDLEYAELLNEEAKQAYYNAQQNLADYIDRNQNLATRSAQVTKDRLENEATLAFNLYNETSLQVQAAKSRVQEKTPVYTEITPATVPILPSSPRKVLILIAFTFLFFMGICAWILFGAPMLSQYKSKVKQLKSQSSDQTAGSLGPSHTDSLNDSDYEEIRNNDENI